MKAVLTGGGTAGHVTPAIALAEELQSRGWEIQFAGTETGIEKKLAEENGFAFTSFRATGFNRRKPWTLPVALGTMKQSSRKARKWLRDIGADAVICFGGYVSVPVGYAAEKEGIPVIVHEQNSYMGLANKELGKHAARICLSYGEAWKGEMSEKVALTGNPVRRSVIEADREEGRAKVGLREEDHLLVVFGGSLGAKHINEGIAAIADQILNRGWKVFQVTGKSQYEDTVKALGNIANDPRWTVVDYCDYMGIMLAAADAVVARSGASSLAEISALAKPALLIPFPYATEDHQTVNAKHWADLDCALMVSDAEIDGDKFPEKLFSLLDTETLRQALSQAMREHGDINAAAKLADQVGAVVEEKKQS